MESIWQKCEIPYEPGELTFIPCTTHPRSILKRTLQDGKYQVLEQGSVKGGLVSAEENNECDDDIWELLEAWKLSPKSDDPMIPIALLAEMPDRSFVEQERVGARFAPPYPKDTQVWLDYTVYSVPVRAPFVENLLQRLELAAEHEENDRKDPAYQDKLQAEQEALQPLHLLEKLLGEKVKIPKKECHQHGEECHSDSEEEEHWDKDKQRERQIEKMLAKSRHDNHHHHHHEQHQEPVSIQQQYKALRNQLTSRRIISDSKRFPEKDAVTLPVLDDVTCRSSASSSASFTMQLGRQFTWSGLEDAVASMQCGERAVFFLSPEQVESFIRLETLLRDSRTGAPTSSCAASYLASRSKYQDLAMLGHTPLELVVTVHAIQCPRASTLRRLTEWSANQQLAQIAWWRCAMQRAAQEQRRGRVRILVDRMLSLLQLLSRSEAVQLARHALLRKSQGHLDEEDVHSFYYGAYLHLTVVAHLNRAVCLWQREEFSGVMDHCSQALQFMTVETPLPLRVKALVRRAGAAWRRGSAFIEESLKDLDEATRLLQSSPLQLNNVLWQDVQRERQLALKQGQLAVLKEKQMFSGFLNTSK